MSIFSTRGRKVFTLAGALAVALGGVTLSSSAEAGCPPWVCKKPPYWGWGGPKWGNPGFGPAFGPAFGAGLVGGLVLSQAGAAADQPVCTIVHRRAIDDAGNVYLQRVRVCD